MTNIFFFDIYILTAYRDIKLRMYKLYESQNETF